MRARLGEELEAARVRAAVAFFAAACDMARREQGAETRWWGEPAEVRVEELAREALLSLAEAEDALHDLEQAELLVAVGRGHRIEADVLCESPALGAFDLDAAKAHLHRGGQLVGPATAVLREVVRLADARGAASTTIPRLVEETLYGRTRVTQALAVLQDAGLLERRDLANRMVLLQLPVGTAPPPPRAPARQADAGGAATTATAARGGRMRLPTNAPIQIGGEVLQVAPGMTPELELGEDGRYYLWIGPVRIGPYDG
ncbi:MAG TPA: hypothetical protein VGR37_10080 [Longimicrobiaceae bacterium]|nr:hypothetical protein [Longimicrobiaceae bacterium]